MPDVLEFGCSHLLAEIDVRVRQYRYVQNFSNWEGCVCVCGGGGGVNAKYFRRNSSYKFRTWNHKLRLTKNFFLEFF